MELYNFQASKEVNFRWQRKMQLVSCSLPREPAPPRGHLENWHLGLISSAKGASFSSYLEVLLGPGLVRLGQRQWLPFSLWTSWLPLSLLLSVPLPSTGYRYKAARQPHNFSSPLPHITRAF